MMEREKAQRKAAMARLDGPGSEARPARGAPHARLVVSFVDRNWLWSRFGLGLSLVLAALVVALALMPLPGGMPARAGLDKIYYFGAFLVLVFPVIVTDTSRWTWVVPAAIVFGGAIEISQPLMGRNADWLDFAAAIAGVLAGAALAEMLHNRIRRSVLGDEADLRTDLVLTSDDQRLDAMRADLMAELRVVLREELEAVTRREGEARPAAARAAHAARPVATAAPQGGAAPLPARPPLKSARSDALERAKMVLRAKGRSLETPGDLRPEAPDEAAMGEAAPRDAKPGMPPPYIPRPGPPPEGGAPTRH